MTTALSSVGPARWVRMIALLTVLALALRYRAQPPATAANGARTTVPDFEAIDKFVEAEMQAQDIPGLALGIVQGDQIVHLKGFGIADPSGRAVTPQTPFILGSTTKSFTALIAQNPRLATFQFKAYNQIIQRS